MPTLEVQPRELKGRKNYQIRNEGQIPAVVYGAVNEPKNVSVDRNAFVKLFSEAGESTLIELKVAGGESLNALIQDIQLDPVRDEVIHADFRVVDMNTPIEAEAKLEFTGESLAVKGLGGTLVTPRSTVVIKALPNKLVASVEVDLSALATFDDVIHISDLKVPEGVEIVDEPELTLAVVTPPRSEEEMAALDEAVEGDVSAVEVAGEKKEEGEEAGEAPADAPAKEEEKSE